MTNTLMLIIDLFLLELPVNISMLIIDLHFKDLSPKKHIKTQF